MKLLLILLICTFSFCDILYKQGWNLLGGEVDLSNIDKEEIWVFVNQQWILRPNKVEKNQGFWFNAPSSGSIKTYNHIFEKKMPALYSLNSLIIQYTKADRELSYQRDSLKNSYIKINQDLSFEEHINIELNTTNTISQTFKGKFMSLSDIDNKIVEYDIESDFYFVSSIVLTDNILVLIRQEKSSQYGVIKKKYTYTRE